MLYILDLRTVVRQVYCSAVEIASSTHWIGGCVGSRVSLDVMENRESVVVP
jgi:hypothetical protein